MARIDDVARRIVGSAGGDLRVTLDSALPAVVNDDTVTAAVERAARPVLGDGQIIKGWRNAFSDDFGLFMAAAPGCLLLLGTANPANGITELWHRRRFDIDEVALSIGVHMTALAAVDLLRED